MIQAQRGLARYQLYRTGHGDEAAEIYRGLLEQGGGAELRFRLGSIAYERGNRADAIAYWREALDVDPGHLQARTRLRLIESAARSIQG